MHSSKSVYLMSGYMFSTSLVAWQLYLPVQMACLMWVPHGLLHAKHWPSCPCRCTFIVCVSVASRSHFGLVTAGSVMNTEVESLKAAIQRLQQNIFEGHHPAATNFPPETLNQLWKMYNCTNLVNRQNQLPGALMDAGECCLLVVWVTQLYSSTPQPFDQGGIAAAKTPIAPRKSSSLHGDGIY